MMQQITSLTDYINIVEEIKQVSESNGNNAELLFRGQRQDQPLLPKLARLNLNGKMKHVERLM